MADLKRTRKQFVIAASVLAVVTLAALAYLAFPVGPTNTDLTAQLVQANKELAIKEAQAEPLRGLPEKLVKTNQDIIDFYRKRLPVNPSDISEELGKLASGSNIALSDVKYEDFDTQIPGLHQVTVEAQLTGEYSKIAKFINAAERDNMFLIVNAITLDDQKTGQVRLQIHFETYLRPAFAELAAGVKPDDIKLPAANKKQGGTKTPAPVNAPQKARP
jgi:type IV pilus assembly protein PilO